MSKKDYGTKLAASLRQAKQMGTQATPPSTTPAAPAKPAAPPAPRRQTAPATTRKPASQSLHPARVWPD